MEELNEKSRAIGKMKDSYLIVNEPNNENFTLTTPAIIVDKNGVSKTGWLTLGTLTRGTNWEKIDIPFQDLFGNKKTTAVDGLLGFATGDALGVPVEFMDRESVRKTHLTEMLGCDTNMPFYSRWGEIIPAGAWSDDTSMLIAGMDSLTKSNLKIDYKDIMDKYIKWWYKGEYCSLNNSEGNKVSQSGNRRKYVGPFGLGGCVYEAFNAYLKGTEPLECGSASFDKNGNGSLMRIFPFSIYCIDNKLNEEETCDYISKASKITHGHEISQMGCFIYTEFLKKVMETKNPKMALSYIQSIDYFKYYDRKTIDAYKQLLNSQFVKIDDEKIKASGYVVDTLESVIYSVLHGTNYEDTILTAINMGYDTDTVAGITGSIAGMLYGKESIPERWLSKVKRKDYLEELGTKFQQVLDEKKKKEEISKMVDTERNEDSTKLTR